MLALLAAVAVLAAPVPPAERPAPTHFVWPAQGTITSPFGPRAGGFHPGIDIGILRSLTVRAAAAGPVTLVGTPAGYEGYGTIVAVDVGGGYTTIYAHLASFAVHVGDEVEAGEPIAVAGCTGWCSGTHLHFELRLRGRSVNPLRIPIG